MADGNRNGRRRQPKNLLTNGDEIMSEITATLSDTILSRSTDSKRRFLAKYHALPKYEAQKMISVSTLRIEREKLSKWVLIGYCETPNGYGEAFLSLDTSEYFKVLIFEGRQTQTNEGYWFGSEQKMLDFIESWEGRNLTQTKLKTELNNIDLRETDLIKKGDIFQLSFGHKEKSVYFYQVMKIRGKKSVDVRRIESETTTSPSDPTNTSIKPVKNAFIGDTAFTCRASFLNLNEKNQKITIKIPQLEYTAYLMKPE